MYPICSSNLWRNIMYCGPIQHVFKMPVDVFQSILYFCIFDGKVKLPLKNITFFLEFDLKN